MRGGKRALCTTSFFYESVMRLKGGQKGYSRKTVAAHIKVVNMASTAQLIEMIDTSLQQHSQGKITDLSRLLVPINFGGYHWILLVRCIGFCMHGDAYLIQYAHRCTTLISGKSRVSTPLILLPAMRNMC